MKKKIFTGIVSLITLFCIELFSLIYLSFSDSEKPFFINLSEPPSILGDYFAFDQLDPLLGWSMSKDNISALGFKSLNNSIFIKTELSNRKKNSCNFY